MPWFSKKKRMQFKITDSVRIKKQTIWLGKEKIFFSENETGLNEFLKEAYNFFQLSYPKFHKMDGLSKLGLIASEILFKKRDISPDTALVFSNSSSSLETDRIYQDSMQGVSSPGIFVYTLPNIVVGEISIKNGLHGENVFFVSEKFNAALLKDYAGYLLESFTVPAAVCAWIEWKNAEYDVFLCLISREGKLAFTEKNLKELYFFNNE